MFNNGKSEGHRTLKSDEEVSIYQIDERDLGKKERLDEVSLIDNVRKFKLRLVRTNFLWRHSIPFQAATYFRFMRS